MIFPAGRIGTVKARLQPVDYGLIHPVSQRQEQIVRVQIQNLPLQAVVFVNADFGNRHLIIAVPLSDSDLQSGRFHRLFPFDQIVIALSAPLS